MANFIVCGVDPATGPSLCEVMRGSNEKHPPVTRVLQRGGDESPAAFEARCWSVVKELSQPFPYETARGSAHFLNMALDDYERLMQSEAVQNRKHLLRWLLREGQPRETRTWAALAFADLLIAEAQ